MKVQEIIYKILVLIMLGALIVGVFNLDEKTNFYEYKNSKINLLQVKKIDAKVSYYATLAEDRSEDINKKFSTTFNRAEIKNIQSFLTVAKNSKFYNIEIVAYMMFDEIRVELYRSDRYIKYAAHYSVNDYLLKTLENYGIDDFQYNSLLTLKDKVYTDKDKFVDDVVSCAKLKKGSWSQENIPKLGLGKKGLKFMDNVAHEINEKHLSDEDIESIVLNLQKALRTYEEIR